ncbi:MAG: hypothetical protein Q9164_004689 [Protoblastenia rupestris]
MIPGQTYIGVLPGQRRPSFVRKRPKPHPERWTFCDFLSHVFAPARHALLGSGSSTMRSWRRSSTHGSDYDREYDYYSRRRRSHRRSRSTVTHGRVRAAATPQQTCSACGKFRSPSWQARHPVFVGETPTPSLCKTCRKKSTSSEDSEHVRQGRRRHSYRHCHGTDTCDDSSHLRSHRPPPLPIRHYHHPHSSPPSASHESINIHVEDSSHRDRATIREPTTSTEDEVRVTSEVTSRLRSRSSVAVDDHYPRRRRSVSIIRYVRSRSPEQAHVVDELDEIRRPRRRSRSTSRVSFSEEPDEIILPKPRSYSRRPRVYYDGADSGQSEGKSNPTTAEQQTRPETSRDDSEGRSRRRSGSRHYYTDPTPSTPLGGNVRNARSCSRAGRAYDSSTSSQALVGSKYIHATPSKVPSRPTSVGGWKVGDAALLRDKSLRDCPTNMSYRDQSPMKPYKHSRNPTSEQVLPPRKRRRCYRETLNHAGSESEGACPTPRKSGYRHIPASLLEAPRSASPRMRTSMPITPDHPDHPDHLAWLLSSHYITPVETAPGEWKYYDNRQSPLSAEYSPPATPTDHYGTYDYNEYSGDNGFGHATSANKTFSEMDYDEAAYYEAKGREYMERLEAEKAEREYLEHAYG